MNVPSGYGRKLVTLDWLTGRLLAHHHPEYVRRLVAWLADQDGEIGVGGGWRATGTQPDRPGFAPEGRSFHQDQRFSDGFVGAAAVDLVARNGALVHRAPYWSEVPRQGSAAAKRYGVHCNIDSESWHMQPVELDGWQSWVNAGRPAPVPNYGVPTPPTPPTPPDPAPDKENETMLLFLFRPASNHNQYTISDGIAARRVRAAQVDELQAVIRAGTGPKYHDPATRQPITSADAWTWPVVTDDMARLLGVETIESLDQ